MGEETLGDPEIAIASVVVCRRLLFYSHQRPHKNTRSPMSVEIGPKACILVALGQRGKAMLYA